MSEELTMWGEALRSAPLFGRLAIIAVAATLCAAGFGLVASRRARTPLGRLLAMGPAVLLTSGTLAWLAVLIASERSLFLAFATGTEDAGWFGSIRPVVREQHWLALLGPLLLFAVPLTIVALTRLVRSGRELGYAAAFVSFVTGACVWLELGRIRDALMTSGHHIDTEIFLHGAFAESSARIDQMVAVVAAAALLSMTFVWVARRRATEPLGWRAAAGAGLVFVLGALAFAGTRGHAHDRHHPVSLRSDSLLMDDPIRRAPAWVEAARCAPLEIAPVVELVDGDHARLDGRSVSGIGLEQDLETYRRNWNVLHPREPFGGSLVVTAPPSMSSERLRGWLGHAYAAGYVNVQFAFATPELVSTSTLGEVEVMHRCAVSFFLDPCKPITRDLAPSVEGYVRDVYEGRRTSLAVDELNGRAEWVCGER